MKLNTVILAAGQGTRMRSAHPKVLHRLAGRPLLEHVIDTAEQLHSEAVHVVYGHGGETVPAALAHREVDWVLQAEQLGTGHAVMQAMPTIRDDANVLVLYGDVPWIRASTLTALLEQQADGVALLTVELDDPSGYGRIIRDDQDRVLRIVEHKDASDRERDIREVNTGILSVSAGRLRSWLASLKNNNSQGEYYLTDIIGMAVSEGVTVRVHRIGDPMEAAGVNDRRQLALLERAYQRRCADELMTHGVTFADPARYDQRGRVSVGRDVSIDVNVILEGNVELADNVNIGPNTLIRDSRIGEGVHIMANCVIEDAVVGAHSRIGPYARLRPETELAEHVHIGNFVEIKKSTVATGSKINHLSYVGDTTVGSHVNIGAGTITCNYDGANKHRTVIGDRAFIGSDTQLVAPVTVGDGATIGAGSTITRDTPPEQLTLSKRNAQISVSGWTRPVKKPKTDA